MRKRGVLMGLMIFLLCFSNVTAQSISINEYIEPRTTNLVYMGFIEENKNLYISLEVEEGFHLNIHIYFGDGTSDSIYDNNAWYGSGVINITLTRSGNYYLAIYNTEEYVGILVAGFYNFDGTAITTTTNTDTVTNTDNTDTTSDPILNIYVIEILIVIGISLIMATVFIVIVIGLYRRFIKEEDYSFLLTKEDIEDV